MLRCVHIYGLWADFSHGVAEMRSCAYLEPGREEEAGGMAKHTRRAWGMDVGIERERDAMKCIGF